MFVNQAEKIASYVGFDTLTEWRVNNKIILRCLFMRGCCGVSFM